ncbi:hypothetical protein BSKO_05077 [Bryopsis sp. KO-2023]|nr:hypothetical protein BSKO_05077 [Bryopsis sp. KO-2023]
MAPLKATVGLLLVGLIAVSIVADVSAAATSDFSFETDMQAADVSSQALVSNLPILLFHVAVVVTQ